MKDKWLLKTNKHQTERKIKLYNVRQVKMSDV